MGIDTMGKVVVSARIESLEDLFDVARGRLTADQVRHVDVEDALVDTGATALSLPKRLIDRIGLRPYRTRQARTSAGVVTVQIYESVRLTVQGRDCNVDVAEVPEDCPVLIGFLPLEALDFVVDPVNRRLTGNPDHGGEHMLDLY